MLPFLDPFIRKYVKEYEHLAIYSILNKINNILNSKSNNLKIIESINYYEKKQNRNF